VIGGIFLYNSGVKVVDIVDSYDYDELLLLLDDDLFPIDNDTEVSEK